MLQFIRRIVESTALSEMIASRNQFSPNEKKINDENQPGIVAEPVRKKSEDWKVNQSNGEGEQSDLFIST